MLKTIRLLLLLFTLGFSVIVQGIVISSLYTVKIQTKSQSLEERVSAFKQGLMAVLVKVSGNARVTDLSGLNEAIEKSTSYVQTFSYSAVAFPAEGFELNIKFNKQSIDDLLKQNGQPVWRQDRPLTLVWMMEKKSNGVEIPNLSHEAELNHLLVQQANFRGIAWLFPLLDMTDFQQINSNTFWNESIDFFKLLSKRYAPDEILIIRLDDTQPSEIKAAFSLVFSDQVVNWEELGNERLSVLQKGLESAINYLAAHFAEVQPQINANDVILRIENLKNIEDYANLMRYLHNLTGVESVNVSNISFPTLEIKLGLSVPVESLKRTIRLNSVLQPLEELSNARSQSPQQFLTYQFHSI